jgi:hypothetical protein
MAVGELADPGPEGGVCDRAEAAWVATLAGTLPERQQAVLAVRASGADGSETAARLHLTYKSVESAMSRARATLRLALASTLGFLAALYRRMHVEAVPVLSAALSLAAGSLVGGGTARTPVPALGASMTIHDTYDAARPALLSAPAAPIVTGPTGRVTIEVDEPLEELKPALPPKHEPDGRKEIGPHPGSGVTLELEWYQNEDHVDSILRCAQNLEISSEVIGCRPR